MTDWKALGSHLLENRHSNVYLLKCDEWYKLGIGDNIKKRIAELQVGNPREIFLLTSFSAPRWECYAFEQQMHASLKLLGLHERGEWFRVPEDLLEWVLESMSSKDAIVFEEVALEEFPEINEGTRIEPRYQNGILRGFAVRQRNKGRASQYVGKRSNPAMFEELKRMAGL